MVTQPQNSFELGAAAFFHHMLARFGATTEVLSDPRKKFLGAFEEFCTKVLSDHRTTLRG